MTQLARAPRPTPRAPTTSSQSSSQLIFFRLRRQKRIATGSLVQVHDSTGSSATPNSTDSDDFVAVIKPTQFFFRLRRQKRSATGSLVQVHDSTGSSAAPNSTDSNDLQLGHWFECGTPRTPTTCNWVTGSSAGLHGLQRLRRSRQANSIFSPSATGSLERHAQLNWLERKPTYSALGSLRCADRGYPGGVGRARGRRAPQRASSGPARSCGTRASRAAPPPLLR